MSEIVATSSHYCLLAAEVKLATIDLVISRLIIWTLLGVSLAACAARQEASLEPKGRLTAKERLQIELANMHFNNEDFEMARKEYLRLYINQPSGFIREHTQFMLAESYFQQRDWPMAERYFLQYLQEFPNGYKRAESDVRLEECRLSRLKAEKFWSTGHLRQELSKPVVTEPKPSTPWRKKRRIWMKPFRTTWYWIVQEREFAVKDLRPLLTPQGQEIAQVPDAFLRRLLIEGTGRLRDGRLVNWAAPERFMVVGEHAPFGLGAQGRSLIPFRTVAVDSSVIPLGTVLYIKEFDGVELPGGLNHDGCFVAGDVGSAIKKRRLDLFSPVYRHAVEVMRKVPEWVYPRLGTGRCQTSYAVADGLHGRH